MYGTIDMIIYGEVLYDVDGMQRSSFRSILLPISFWFDKIGKFVIALEQRQLHSPFPFAPEQCRQDLPQTWIGSIRQNPNDN
jgi:hypothetical protein